MIKTKLIFPTARAVLFLERKNIFLFNQSKTVLKTKTEIASYQSEIRYLILIIEK
jgi:hypothetical protein